jgi:tryptophan synthase beta chain
VAEAIKMAPKMGRDQILVVNVSGRGDKDIGIMTREMDLSGHLPPKAEI